jgi:hypothetical protein
VEVVAAVVDREDAERSARAGEEGVALAQGRCCGGAR